jgi:hypothetical protein
MYFREALARIVLGSWSSLPFESYVKGSLVMKLQNAKFRCSCSRIEWHCCSVFKL